MSSERGDVAFTRLASYSSAMPVSSRLSLSSYTAPRGAGYRASSLERGGYAPLSGKLGSRLGSSTTAASTSTYSRRPPLPEYRRRGTDSAAARASPARPAGRRDASAEPDAITEARRYLQERRDRLTRSESREPAGAGRLASLLGSDTARLLDRLDGESRLAAGRWREARESQPRERLVPMAVEPRAAVGELRRQFDAAAPRAVDGEEAPSPSQEPADRVVGGRTDTAASSAVNGLGRRQRTASGSDKWERYLASPTTASLPRSRRDSGLRDSGLRDSGLRDALQRPAENGERQEPSSPTSRRAALLSESVPTAGSSRRCRLEESSGSSSSTRSASRPLGLCGLRNIGNTCFMNSVLQCLSNTRALHDYILRDEYSSDINTTTSSMKGALIKAFSTLMCDLWKKSDDADRVLTTAPFKSQIQRFAARFMGYQQQDAQEFLRYLLEGLHEDVNRVTSRPKPITTDIDDSLSPSQKSMEAWKRFLRLENSKFVDIFVGQLKSTLRCTVCGHESVTFDPFWDLSLPIPAKSGQVRLQACVDLFTKEEVLDGDEKPTCAKCQKRQKCTKGFTIQRFPRILVVHLKRFSPQERFRGKLNTAVDFPVSGLDLSPYSAGQGPCKYNLYGVANHSGTLFSGHYTAFCKHPHSGEWYEYNDARVKPISMRALNSSEAYVLFYELAGSAHL